jgi:hypothetical protein
MLHMVPSYRVFSLRPSAKTAYMSLLLHGLHTALFIDECHRILAGSHPDHLIVRYYKHQKLLVSRFFCIHANTYVFELSVLSRYRPRMLHLFCDPCPEQKILKPAGSSRHYMSVSYKIPCTVLLKSCGEVTSAKVACNSISVLWP